MVAWGMKILITTLIKDAIRYMAKSILQDATAIAPPSKTTVRRTFKFFDSKRKEMRKTKISWH